MNSSCADSHCHGQMRHLPRGIDQMPLTTSSAILPHEKVLSFLQSRDCLIYIATQTQGREQK